MINQDRARTSCCYRWGCGAERLARGEVLVIFQGVSVECKDFRLNNFGIQFSSGS